MFYWLLLCLQCNYKNLKIKTQSGVNAVFRLGIEMLDCKNRPKETCALCQLITSLYVIWIIDMIYVHCSCMDITKSYLFQLMRLV